MVKWQPISLLSCLYNVSATREKQNIRWKQNQTETIHRLKFRVSLKICCIFCNEASHFLFIVSACNFVMWRGAAARLMLPRKTTFTDCSKELFFNILIFGIKYLVHRNTFKGLPLVWKLWQPHSIKFQVARTRGQTVGLHRGRMWTWKMHFFQRNLS